MYYFRRKAYDSAIIYFKDVVQKFRHDARPRASRELRLVEAYKAIKYRDDSRRSAPTLRAKYPDDREVTRSARASQSSP